MNKQASITVAPNGARLQKADHRNVPLSVEELADTAAKCHTAGAQAIHLHVRDAQGIHSLDAELYRAAIDAVSNAAPHMRIQITTEAVGRYEVADQLCLLDDLKPAAASVSVREIARAPKLAEQLYETAAEHGIQVQHILYGMSCFDQLKAWMRVGIVPAHMRDAILVLGQYTPKRAGQPGEFSGFLDSCKDARLEMTVCAFGPQEQACLIKAYKMGCDLRVGFENNRYAPDGSLWEDNAQSVASLRAALASYRLGASACE